ncbi:TolB family protein [Plantactinospora sonchi]|uniref:WD40 repeat domain-containing protein n=1 Tax=Plantactinospora sonchi TaxID=1544735 RepID=A0ABU7RQB2_9ACTN
MSGNAERVLREAVHELAGDPHQSPDFVAGVISRGRRVRRRRRAGATAAMLVAIAAIAAPYVWLRPETEPPPTAVAAAPEESEAPELTTDALPPIPDPSPVPPVRKDWQNGPLVLPGGWIALAVSAPIVPGSWVYDRTAGRYVSLGKDYQQVLPAPRGSLVAVQRNAGSSEIGLLDLSTREVRWTSAVGAILSPQWSRDGSQLLVTIFDKQPGGARFGILDPANGSFRQFPVSNRQHCTDICRFSWLPNGREVALPQFGIPSDPGPDPKAKRPQFQMEIFAADDGAPIRVVPVPGSVSGTTSWSPDGRYLAVQAANSPQLVDVGTGRSVGRLPSADVTWVRDDRLLYLDFDDDAIPAAVLIDLKGVEIQRLPLPRDFVKAKVLVVPN